jgi:NADH:ubiquinone oxidoreductase subunit 6 (subunit J)
VKFGFASVSLLVLTVFSAHASDLVASCGRPLIDQMSRLILLAAIFALCLSLVGLWRGLGSIRRHRKARTRPKGSTIVLILVSFAFLGLGSTVIKLAYDGTTSASDGGGAQF